MGPASVRQNQKGADPSKSGLRKVEVALLSAYHKEGLVEFARGLERLGVRILSSGGSAAALRERGIPVEEVSDYTGWPEMLGGRVKTLHPKVHAGVLARRDDAGQMDELASAGILPIDLVAIDPYPFEEIAASSDSRSRAVEGIDIGGPALLRAAAKNHEFVVVIPGRALYGDVLDVLEANDGATDLDCRRRWAADAFDLVSRYDAKISSFLGSDEEKEFPSRLPADLRLTRVFRYGENPHQRAALYREEGAPEGTAVGARQIQGKAISFNNMVDLDAAVRLAASLDRPGAAVIKHANPCGVAVDDVLRDAFVRARRTDEKSAFGGVIAVNRPLDGETAAAIVEFFVEAVIAPEVTEEAREILARKKKLVVLEAGDLLRQSPGSLEIRSVWGGVVAQEWDPGNFSWDDVQVVTDRKPTDEEIEKMTFGWRVVRFVRSNAIVFADARATTGIGAGQMSRVDSVRLAIRKAREAGLEMTGLAMASDGFFPFPDSLEVASEVGVQAVIQPGGSIRDQKVVDRANELGMTMAMTGCRHFKH
ncbi:MAG: bifunctional phosphoribosylaminoimidazolecarboxamide formyltransferase/IMP cyclohydrolase [Candidatus Eisenbacteria sp.]|nr:bifunctional phosphoribosylaminoimidazolecarboxamide formyltransferase/IMP cyclohydrolase [Candidatus Eisenbacteria bacterium]